MMRISEAEIHNHLNKGGLIIGANTLETAEYAMKKLVEQTSHPNAHGLPNFYYVNGPLVVMTKENGEYYWMIDYPIKYNPGNILNYVNKSQYWNVAKTMYRIGMKLLNNYAPVFFLTPKNVYQENNN